MLVLLTEKYNLDPKRFSIGGYADTVPVASNDTEEGRGLNRRVDVVLLRQHVVVASPAGDNTAVAESKPSAVGPPVEAVKKH
jgi:chemotaxis protein MotB